jgi:hypothetical protein
MKKHEFRIAYREARKVRRLERTFRERIREAHPDGFGLLSISRAIPFEARQASFRIGDALALPLFRQSSGARVSRLTFRPVRP